MTRPAPRSLGAFVGVAGLIAALSAGSTVALGAAAGGLDTHHISPSGGCSAPALPGAVITITVSDVSAMMSNGQMGWRSWHTGMMRLTSTPTITAHGTVSLRVTNTGAITHEVVVLPLPSGRPAGGRTVGADGKVDEAGSLGEASRSCGDGAGDGIVAGATGWTTLTLNTGRYELVCDLPGHYRAGMYTELTIT